MKRDADIEIEIDILTNSIQNAISGDVFNTSVVRLYKNNSREIKKAEWVFDWQGQLRLEDREVYKLVIENNNDILQGLVSFSDRGDHIYMNLIESARFNKGASKLYLGVPGNLVAFGCKLAFEKEYLGYLAFDAKTALIEHYVKTLHATHFKGTKMVIETAAAKRLVEKYFKTD